MNAIEARLQAEAIAGDRHEKELSHVRESILDAVSKGKFETHIYNYMHDSVAAILKRDGFFIGVETSSGPNETRIKIGW